MPTFSNEIVDGFVARDNSGALHKITVWANIVYTRVDDDTERSIREKSYKMPNGTKLNPLDDVTFEEPTTERILRRL